MSVIKNDIYFLMKIKELGNMHYLNFGNHQSHDKLSQNCDIQIIERFFFKFPTQSISKNLLYRQNHH